MTSGVELSIVMPCLNEAETVGTCISKAQAALAALGVTGEVIVADNGSTDGSQAIARELGARVVEVPTKGYGSALRGGIAAACGRYVLMGDADDSYDFGDAGPFLERLRAGDDLVMGNRFKGGIRPGAMPLKHRWFGNPVLTGLGRLFFHAPVGDFHCGMRAFRKDAYERLDLRTTGMEFASEMVIKASLGGLRISEVPVVLHPDGRSRPPHLRSWRDGWRHLRFMLLFSPRWLFLVPGIALMAVGVAATAWLLTGAQHVGPLRLDIGTLMLTSLLVLIGYQAVQFSLFTEVFAARSGFHPAHRAITRLFGLVTLEVGLLAGAAMMLLGLAALGAAVALWHARGYGNLDPAVSMRQLIPAGILLALGAQTIFASFFLSFLGIRAEDATPPEAPEA